MRLESADMQISSDDCRHQASEHRSRKGPPNQSPNHRASKADQAGEGPIDLLPWSERLEQSSHHGTMACDGFIPCGVTGHLLLFPASSRKDHGLEQKWLALHEIMIEPEEHSRHAIGP